MLTQSQRLRQLFAGKEIIRVVGAHDALGAKLAERAGFEAVWSSGLEISTSFAVPNANILTMSEFLAAAASMADAVRIPVIADCDTGFGNSNNVIRLVQKYEAAGVAAVCIEDKLFPKVNSFIPGRQELAPIAEFVGKIMAAKNAQQSPDFMVVARVEALIAGQGQAEALRRATEYARAGADAILMHSSKKSPDEIIEFARAWDFSAPLVVVPTTYYKVTAHQLQELGIKAVIYANHGLRASIRSVLDTYREILEAGSTAPVEERIAPMSLVFELQGMPQLQKAEQSYLHVGPPATRAIIPAAGDHLDEYSMKHIAADIPMAMLDINGKSLLRRQVEALNQIGIHDVTVVGGYKRERIVLDGVKVVENPQWSEESGEMRSILLGDQRSEPQQRTLVAYSDVLFDPQLCRRLAECDADIVVVVDITYDPEGYGPRGKRPDLVSLADPLRLRMRRMFNGRRLNSLLRIGQGLSKADAHCEFTGLALFSERGWNQLLRCYESAQTRFDNQPFHEAPSFKGASLTDMIQELVDQGHPVHCLEVSSGWTEIHSFEDYKRACRLIASEA